MSTTDVATIEGSAFGLDLGGTNRRDGAALPGEEIIIVQGATSDYESVVELCRARFAARGYTPEVVVLAMAGDWSGKVFRFTNLPWEPVTEQHLQRALGVRRVIIVNDMQAAQFGARSISPALLVELKSGTINLRRHLGVLTLSTGVNWNTGPRDGPLSLSTEHGHETTPWVSWRSPANGLIEFVAAKNRGERVRIEQLLGGSTGANLIAEYLMTKMTKQCIVPTPDQGADYVWRCIQEEKSLAEAMTVGAMEDDHFWVQAARLYAEVLGLVANSIIIGDNLSELLIQGPVLNGTPGFAKWLFSTDQFHNALYSEGKKGDLVKEVVIYGVPEVLHMAALGAYECALWEAQNN